MCRRAEEVPAAAPETLPFATIEREERRCCFRGNREIGGN
jgi:hypothetical protein